MQEVHVVVKRSGCTSSSRSSSGAIRSLRHIRPSSAQLSILLGLLGSKVTQLMSSVWRSANLKRGSLPSIRVSQETRNADKTSESSSSLPLEPSASVSRRERFASESPPLDFFFVFDLFLREVRMPQVPAATRRPSGEMAAAPKNAPFGRKSRPACDVSVCGTKRKQEVALTHALSGARTHDLAQSIGCPSRAQSLMLKPPVQDR